LVNYPPSEALRRGADPDKPRNEVLDPDTADGDISDV
jgi:hypothetical protein